MNVRPAEQRVERAGIGAFCQIVLLDWNLSYAMRT